MANNSASTLLAGQALFNEQMKSGEWRPVDSNAVRTANKGQIANPALGALRTQENRAVKAYFPIRKSAGSATARVARHTGTAGDSAEKDITWSTFSETFSISLTRGLNNMIPPEMEYAIGLRNAIDSLLARVDSWFVTQLLADKTQVNAGGGLGAFDGVTNDYQVALALENTFFSNVKAMMEKNLYNGQLTGIIDSPANVIARNSYAQGNNNGDNLNYQFMGFDTLAPTTKDLLSSTTYKASGLFFQNGLVAVLPWIPQKNRKALNPQLVGSYNGDYGSISIPELGIDFAISAYSDRADGSAVGGENQDVTTQFEVSIDMGYQSAPLSTANESVVFSAGLLKS